MSFGLVRLLAGRQRNVAETSSVTCSGCSDGRRRRRRRLYENNKHENNDQSSLNQWRRRRVRSRRAGRECGSRGLARSGGAHIRRRRKAAPHPAGGLRFWLQRKLERQYLVHGEPRPSRIAHLRLVQGWPIVIVVVGGGYVRFIIISAAPNRESARSFVAENIARQVATSGQIHLLGEEPIRPGLVECQSGREW